MSCELIRIDRLSRTFVTRRLVGDQRIAALDDVTLSLRRGRMLALVGESGSGKSTVPRLLMRLYRLSGGSIKLLHEGRLTEITVMHPCHYYRRVQMVFQHPYSAPDSHFRWQCSRGSFQSRVSNSQRDRTDRKSAHAWNAITVGAFTFTEKVVITDPTYEGWEPVAPVGDL